MKKLLILCLTFTIATELEVDGNLKVTGSVDASGNPITNVGEPVLTTDVATANYVLERTAGKGRIIILKCPWYSYVWGNEFLIPSIETCEPPTCPEGWNELTTFNEITSVNTIAGQQYNKIFIGNSNRYCIEQETE